MALEWLSNPVSQLNDAAREAALQRQGQLTKPPGSLGRLEDLAVSLAAMQGHEKPTLEKVHITVFAADHGVAEEGVSAFPQAVTVEMIRNFSRGGAAISVLARSLEAPLEVVDVGAALDVEPMQGVISERAASGTANFCKAPAMSEEQLTVALAAGRHALQRAQENGAQLFIGGEMGIANTTAATAIACALLKRPATELVGPGTGLDNKGMQHKAEVIERALAFHLGSLNEPLPVLQHLGGFEIAALVGAYIAAGQAGITILVDGFISTAAALVAQRIQPGVSDWMIFAHASAEPGHAQMVQALNVEPLLDLGMRLGEGSGAASAVPLLRLACELHANMATFAEAGVSEG